MFEGVAAEDVVDPFVGEVVGIVAVIVGDIDRVSTGEHPFTHTADVETFAGAEFLSKGRDELAGIASANEVGVELAIELEDETVVVRAGHGIASPLGTVAATTLPGNKV